MWAAAGLLARWFRFQPSEIDGLEVDDLLAWVKEASRQIRDEGRGG
ncbi:GpE family phage tail protein [Pelomicrobium methylotrophicum]|uniref:GpE family phage tail protein n=1 Tax=Pelomicrobium methylotrophicum TaxID=2602750 RepID=A0A5C7ETI1_9PROT|nr:GpE family phage tail protein [Pelomicrobium methylotrophicum]TXF11995.1 GpE family phage tail protein [Pelomicrobium methylotrophicum]